MFSRYCIFFSLILFSFYTVSAQTERLNINSLSWLKGTWECQQQDYTITEQWMKPSGNTLFAANRTVKGNKTVAYEFLQIKEYYYGDIYFIARPSKQKLTKFKMVKIDKNEVVFENPRHDFPQRIIYKKQEDGSLFARVESLNGKKGYDYIFKKVPLD